MNNKIGLVLAGGGGKGAYHIGVWKALRDFGIDKNINYVSGTSVGALNAVLFAQGNIDIAERVWLDISTEDILHVEYDNIEKFLPRSASFDKAMNYFNSHGIFSRNGLGRIIEANIDFDSISQTNIYAACSDVTKYAPIIRETLALANAAAGKKFGKETYLNLNRYSDTMKKTIMLASSALPVIFGTEEIDGRFYYDGGLTDNVPVQPLYDAGCNYIFVIHLSRDQIIDYSVFPDAKIFEIVPQDSQGSLFAGTLDFSPAGARRRIDQGYMDALNILKPFYEMGLIQHKIKESLYEMKNSEALFNERKTDIMNQRNELKKELEGLGLSRNSSFGQDEL